MHLTTMPRKSRQQLAYSWSSIMRRTAHVLLIILSIASSFANGSPPPHHPHGSSCIPGERAALLSFKKGITKDGANLLASWRGQDCCQWRGIKCSNRTGNVVKLQLGNPKPDMSHYTYTGPCDDANALVGEISPYLLSLKHLKHMDLSMNCLLGSNGHFPPFLGSMGNLRYLNLSGVPFTGRVPPQLGNLSKLQYFDIGEMFASDYFGMYSADITWLTKLPRLNYLRMSGINLSGGNDWPHILNMLPSLRGISLASCSLGSANQSLPYLNLTKLEKLDLSGNSFDHTIGSSWFWRATRIKYLNIRYNRLFGQIPSALGNMTSLRLLDLSFNFINNEIALRGKLENLCSLEFLDFSENDMNGNIGLLMEALPQCAWKQMQELHFGGTSLNGALPSLIEKLTNLNTLDLTDNNLYGIIPSGIGALTSLAYLDLSFNNFSGSIVSEIGALTSLAFLDLSYNNFSGSVPSEIGALTILISLDLSYNNFSGSLPYEIGALTNLTYLDISYNNFSGVITEKNLASLQSLKDMSLSFNNLKVVVDAEWDQPFRLEVVDFTYCQLGPMFPAWLEQQSEIFRLQISRTSLMDRIPDWFWSTFSHATFLDISHNQISGRLPAHLRDMSFQELIIGSNQFSGPLPCLPRNISILDISNNSFSGTLPSYLEAPYLDTLLINSNKISGQIPESLCKLVSLGHLDMSDNLLEGEFPQCFGVRSMMHLLLSNNSFSGTFPAFLKNHTSLKLLDLAWNKFHGMLPTWIGEMQSLLILQLGHNAFYGTIPAEIAGLSNLQYLDLSSNSMSGVIPRNFSSLPSMTLKGFRPTDLEAMKFYENNDNTQFGFILSISTKGQQLRYGRTLEYLVGIDLSGNSLTGGIPTDITSLDAVISLNLSSNQLSGSIPNNIGAMYSLESLDLSNNRLSGGVPSSLSSLSSLSYLNLSYNNLSGRIPSGRQLDTINADSPGLIYIGNSGLCGPPLQKNCSGNDTVVHGYLGSSSDNHEFDPLSFYFGLVLGHVAGLWAAFSVLLFKRTWRVAYFRLFDKMYDKIYVFVVVKWAR